MDPLLPECIVSTANWSEVLQKTLQRGGDAGQASVLFKGTGVTVAALTEDDAEDAATLWTSAPNLSLADRCCLALARRLGLPAVTADRVWSEADAGVSIRVIR